MTAQQSTITEGITENWGNNFQYSTHWLHSLWSGTLLVSNNVASLLIVWVGLFRYVPSCHQITYLTFSDNGINLHCLVTDLLKTFQNPIWGAFYSCCIISIEMHVKTHHLLKAVKTSVTHNCKIRFSLQIITDRNSTDNISSFFCTVHNEY